MKTKKLRSHIITCAITAILSATCAFVAFYQNSWGKWRKNSALSNCLPLPPPIGCAEHYSLREILDGRDTDFAWLCFLSGLISVSSFAACVYVLFGEETPIPGLERHVLKKPMLVSFLLVGILNVLTCLISTFRINIMTTLQRRQGLFLVSGLIPVNSLSFYLSVLAGLLALVGSWIMNMVTFDDVEVRQRLSKTVKQHMARNLMYPDDKRSTKMVTFSSMPSDMEERAAEICVKAVMQFGLEEDIAENIKQTFEAQYGPTWHCAVGANFGSAVHHRINEYIEVSMPQISVLIFRCDEPRTSDLDQTSDSTSPDFR